MAYDQDTANRLRELLEPEQGLTEKAMFGGLAFLMNGHMAVAATSQGGLLLRVDPADTPLLVEHPHADRFVMRGREMDGWLHIAAEAIDTDDELASWVAHGVKFTRGLPPK